MKSGKHDVTDIYGVRRNRFSGYRLPDAPETGFRHSSHYHKYFRGYTEIRKKNAKGRIVVERYYTQPWIVSGLSSKKYWLCRTVYAVLNLAAIAFYILGLCQDIPANKSPLVALSGLPGAILLFLLSVSTVCYIIVPKKMTLWDHASSTKRLKTISVITAGVIALTSVLMVGYLLFTGTQIAHSAVAAASVMLASVMALVIYVIEKRMPYTEVPNNTKLPAGEAHEIW